MRTNDPFIHNYLKDRKEKWVNLYKQGHTLQEIAERYGVAVCTVHRNLCGKVKAVK